MKKNVRTLVVFLLLALSVTACGKKAETPQENVAPEEKTAETDPEGSDAKDAAMEADEKAAALDAAAGDTAEEDLTTVEVHVPSKYLNEPTQEKFDNAVANGLYESAVLNEDGSATLRMTEEQHAALMDTTTQNITATLESTKNSANYPDISDIQANADYTVFTVTVSSDALDEEEARNLMSSLISRGKIYHTYAGEDAETLNIHIDFVSESSGNVIARGDSNPSE